MPPTRAAGFNSHRAAGAAAHRSTLIDYDVPPPPPDQSMYIDRPVLAFGDPEFDFVPPPPAPVYYLPPPPDGFCDSGAATGRRSGCSSCRSRIFVPIPVYCSGRRATSHRRRTTSSSPTSITAPPSTASSTGRRRVALMGGAPLRRTWEAGRTGQPARRWHPGRPAAPRRRCRLRWRSVATLIQQGKAPVPPSAAINPTARTGLPAPHSGAGRRPIRPCRPTRRVGCLRTRPCLGRTRCRFRAPEARHRRRARP